MWEGYAWHDEQLLCGRQALQSLLSYSARA